MDQLNMANMSYQGWDEDAVRERKDDHDAPSDPFPLSSSFTAINSSQTHPLPTPQPSAPDRPRRTWQYYARRGATRRRRNATVAEYLGLGSSEEPAHLEKYAPLPDGPRDATLKLARKRSKLSAGIASGNLKIVGRKSIVSIQRPASEGLKVTKPRGKVADKHETSSADTSQSQSDCILETLSHGHEHADYSSSQGDLSPANSESAVTKIPVPFGHCSQDAMGYSSLEQYNDNHDLGLFGDCGHPDDSDQHQISQLPIADLENCDDEEFGEDLNDEELLELTSGMIDIGPITSICSSSPTKANLCPRPGMDSESAGSSATAPVVGSKEGISTRCTSKKFVSPVTITTRLLAATGDIDSADARTPIVRSPFPDPVRDRSPIIGLSSSTLLRTCFRIGEAINQAHHASKSGRHILFELYARILDSRRDNVRQYFTLCDLFHGKPPYIQASYDAALWRSVQLFDYDSKRLLQQGRICRCMGKMKREGKEWVMTVLNIWEATWDDTKWVEGIVNA
ncbi:hypothetical protein FB567DRAFT_536772 [Paraphoma chrysanthemicola]|uniref:Uncharacterized protein n=1 Tax=Paraphoma chrysanthemicola TaxID=798071 RepID=A0A8K0QW08_9PLEO|nr:hypothetical protein FB567DRAFT_536772 [Paraphoma chrysanthemicola]